ncbi:VanZ family protein [Saccharopolyspora sp. CA-218241]|uniref:VanZ family protein n=1 Tax=Saccharopolyspora sp. CA-218241 TaxID=3240027 RepID=UPI003D98D4CF
MPHHPRSPARRLPFLGVILISVVILFTPASGVPTAPPGTDKLVHLALFTALSATGRRAGFGAPALAAALLGYAAGSEVLQGVLPLGRSADPLDVAVNALGIALGLLLAFGARRLGDWWDGR